MTAKCPSKPACPPGRSWRACACDRRIGGSPPATPGVADRMGWAPCSPDGHTASSPGRGALLVASPALGLGLVDAPPKLRSDRHFAADALVITAVAIGGQLRSGQRGRASDGGGSPALVGRRIGVAQEARRQQGHQKRYYNPLHDDLGPGVPCCSSEMSHQHLEPNGTFFCTCSQWVASPCPDARGRSPRALAPIRVCKVFCRSCCCSSSSIGATAV